MKKMKVMLLTLSSLVVASGWAAPAADSAPAAATKDGVPDVSNWFGANLLGLFNAAPQKPDPRVRGKFEEHYFRWFGDWGFTFARLPMDYRYFLQTNDWTRLRPEGFAKVDQAVAWGRQYGVHVQLCLHRAPGYTVLSWIPEKRHLQTDADAQEAFMRIWREFARRYRGIPNRELSFNLINEPTGFSEKQFIDVFGRTIDAIHEEDPGRFVMLDGNNCASTPVAHFYGVPLTGQAFRGYTPHAISHYLAWYIKPQPEVEPTWPFSDAMAKRRDWVYELPSVTLAKFAAPRANGYPVMIGEFGCYNRLKHATCLAWMEDCLKLWKKAGLGWAIWNVDGAFGFMDSDRTDIRYEDFEGHKLDRRMLDLLRRYAGKRENAGNPKTDRTYEVPKWGAFSTEAAKPSAARPADFDAYWDGEVARFAKEIPLRPEIRLRTDITNAVADIHEVSFAMNADGSRRLYGWLAFPKKAQPGAKLPLYVEVPGAGYGGWTTDPAYSADEIQLKLTVYDFRPTPYSGLSRKADFDAFVKRWTDRYHTPTYSNAGWGASREEVFFHDVWLTMNRAIDWVAETYAAKIDPARVSYTGESQGGGSGFFLLAMNRHFTHGVLRVPAVTDTLGFLSGRKSGWPMPYENQPTADAKARALEIAPYFDATSFAPRIRVPVRVCLGTADVTCPWPNVSAAFNALGSTDKELLVGLGDDHGGNNGGQRQKMERWRRECAGETVVAVAPDGNDSAAGTFAHPVKTLARAQALARAAKAANPRAKVAVRLRGGEYRVSGTLRLGPEDAGTVWTSWKDERPVLTGGRRIGGWQPVAGRPGVFVADAKAAGYRGFEEILPTGYSTTHNVRGGESGHRVNTLYCDGRPLTVARHPNAGFFRMDEVIDKDNRIFRSKDVPGKFDLSKSAAPDLMAHGYFQWLWADEKLPVAVAADGAVKLVWDKKGYPLHGGYPFFLENAAAFVDQPGEWYLDRAKGLVYAMPPAGTDPAKAVWTLAEAPAAFLVARGAQDVRLEGLVFEYGRGDAVRVEMSEGFVFAGNVIRNFGGVGLRVDGDGVTVRGNVLHTFGYDAMQLEGGDRRTLTPSRDTVAANAFSDTGRASRTYTPGILLRGCGTRLVGNWFHDIPSSAMRVEGNDHLILSNLVENVVKESDDQGGSDTWGDPTYGGILFKNNVWRNIRAHGIGSSMTAGIRFDDAISAMTVEGNRFENCCDGHFGSVQIHAGRFNTITNNLMVGGPGAVSVNDWDTWDKTRWRRYLTAPDGDCAKQKYFTRIDISAPVWKARFPWLQHAADTVCTNTVVCNVVVGTKGGTVVMRQNGHTADVGNAVFAKMPSEAELRKVPGFTPPPTAAEVGPRPGDRDYARARANDAR